MSKLYINKIYENNLEVFFILNKEIIGKTCLFINKIECTILSFYIKEKYRKVYGTHFLNLIRVKIPKKCLLKTSTAIIHYMT